MSLQLVPVQAKLLEGRQSEKLLGELANQVGVWPLDQPDSTLVVGFDGSFEGRGGEAIEERRAKER